MPLLTIHGTGSQGIVVGRFGVAARAGAGAIRVGMLPHGSVRTVDTTTCHEFQPFYEVGGDFLDFFTLTDGVIEIYLDHVTGKGLPAALCLTLRLGRVTSNAKIRGGGGGRQGGVAGWETLAGIQIDTAAALQ
jgi:hypothetical protein